MATSITQAKPLLTAAELELFDQSRAEPIKALTEKQLASKEKRARTLRDKYRDLYRRQTVAQRGKARPGTQSGGSAASGRGATGDANARTQRKAEILQEVLDRFEARSALLEARAAREADSKPVPKKSAKTDAETAAGKSTTIAKKSVNDAADGVVQVEFLHGPDSDERSHKAPSDKAPTHGGKTHAPDMHAPLDMLPAAQRANPVRNMPRNIAIQGHLSSSVRRAQGKKDSR